LECGEHRRFGFFSIHGVNRKKIQSGDIRRTPNWPPIAQEFWVAPMRKPSISALVKLGLLLVLIGTALYFRFFTEIGQHLTIESLRNYLAGFPPLVLPLVYIGIYILGTVMLLPGTLLSFVGSLLFGLFEATLYTWIGATIGATLAYLLAKLLGRDFVDQLLAGRLQALDERLGRHGFMGLLILRLVPLFPFNGINFGSGLTSIRLRDYVLATAIGILPGTFVYQYLFAQLGESVLQEGGIKPYDPHLLAAIGLFLVFIVLGKWLSRKLRPSENAKRPG
jgi:uncharacterized membrane protein YdjX (TVP38/TMEM64 family)